MNGERLKKGLYLFAVGQLALLVFFIVLCTLRNMDFADYINSFISKNAVYLYLLTGAVLLAGVVLALAKAVGKASERVLKLLPFIAGALIFGFQLTVIIVIRSPLRSDAGNVFDQAMAMLATGTISPTDTENYFGIYPNNIPLCILEYLLLKLGLFAGIAREQLLHYLFIINVLFIDAAIYFAYGIVKRLKGKKRAVQLLILCGLNPLLYAYSIMVYTSTLSMPFILGPIYFFLCFNNTDSRRKKLIFTVLTAVLLYFGFKLRATVIITAIAILGYIVLQIKNKPDRRLLKEKGVFALAAACAVLVSALLYNGIENRYVKFDTAETGLPVTHWLMMGVQGSGDFSIEDFAYTTSFETREEIEEATLTEYKRRVKNLGFGGAIGLIGRKLDIAWSDGLDTTIDKLDAQTYGTVNDYLTGGKRDLYVSYCHMYNLLLMLLLAVSTVRGLKRRYDNPLFLFYLNMLGGILFHLIWETGPVYSQCFIFITTVLALDGLELVAEKTALPAGRKAAAGVLAAGIMSSVFLWRAGWPNMVDESYKRYDMAVNQDFFEDIIVPMEKGEEYVQTFETSRPFNRVGVKVRNLTGESNKSIYKMELLDAGQNVVAETEVIASLALDWDLYRMPVEVVPDGPTEYQIRITAKKAGEKNNLTFMRHNTGNWKILEKGTLYLNGEETKGSLTFQVYNSTTGAFLTGKQYIAIIVSVVVTGLIALIWIGIPEKRKDTV